MTINLKQKYITNEILIIRFKKSNSTPNYLAMAVDGSTKDLSTALFANKHYVGGTASINIHGFIYGGLEDFSLYLDNSNSHDSIGVGTYTDTSSRFTIKAVYTLYSPHVGPTDFLTGGNHLATAAAAAGIAITNHFVMTITYMDLHYIKGTFNGDVYSRDDPSRPKQSITNGNFYAKYQ
jgi:hypothetical protein